MLRNNLSNIINIFSPGFVLDVSFKKILARNFLTFFTCYLRKEQHLPVDPQKAFPGVTFQKWCDGAFFENFCVCVCVGGGQLTKMASLTRIILNP